MGAGVAGELPSKLRYPGESEGSGFRMVRKKEDFFSERISFAGKIPVSFRGREGSIGSVSSSIELGAELEIEICLRLPYIPPIPGVPADPPGPRGTLEEEGEAPG